jgi:hypothetical protein
LLTVLKQLPFSTNKLKTLLSEKDFKKVAQMVFSQARSRQIERGIRITKVLKLALKIANAVKRHRELPPTQLLILKILG